MAFMEFIGRKVGMTQIFTPDGTLVPVTVVEAGPCLVVQRKTPDKDGYVAIQIGLVESRPDRRANRARKGHFDTRGRRADAKPRGGCRRRRRRAEAGRQGALRHVQGKGSRGRHRRLQGEGLHRRGPAPPFRGRRGDPRLDVPPRARLDRSFRVPVAGHAREPLLRPAGRTPGDREEPDRRAGRHRKEPHLSARRRFRARGDRS